MCARAASGRLQRLQTKQHTSAEDILVVGGGLRPLGNDFHGKHCTHCGRQIHAEPVYRNGEWWHRLGYEEAQKQFQRRADDLATRLGFSPESSRNA